METNEFLNAFIYGSDNLPLDTFYFEVETDDPGHTPGAFRQHTHHFYELLFVRNGNPQYRIGTERFRLEPGDLVLIPPGVNHLPLFSGTDAESYQRYVLWLSKQYANSLLSLFPEGGFQRYGLLRNQGPSRHFVENYFLKGLQESQQQKPGWIAMLHSNTLELMVHLYRAFLDTQSIQPPSEKPQLLDQILDYIEDHLASKITLADTSRHFYVSESTVSTLFRRELGISFYRCVTQRRLIAAKKQILEGMILEEVAQQVGFGDYSSFYRAFKAEYGISPRQLRSRSK